MKTANLDAEGNFVGDCQVGENGTVVIRGPNVLTGDKRSSDDEEAFLDDGWLITGDLDRVDGDGYIWLTGRSKDVIIRGTRRSLTTGSSSSETAR